jgi:predicted acetyltransferase
MDIRTLDNGRRHKRELLIEGELASWLWVIDHQMRIGTAQVHMGGIGGVNTDYRYRMKGYMRALLEDTVRYMTGQGYDVSMLFGISGFYPKFGYASCLPSHKQIVQTRDAEDAGKEASKEAGSYATCALKDEDIDGVRALYNRNNAARTASIVRCEKYFTKFTKGTAWWGEAPVGFVLKDQAGQVAAYAVYDKSDRAVNVSEIESRDDTLFAALMSALAEQAIEKRCGQITFHLPPDHAFAEYAQRFGCKWETDCPRNGGGMMRILNLEALMVKVRAELERRIALSRMLQQSGSLTIETDLGAVTLNVEQGRLALGAGHHSGSLLNLSQDRLTQMLVGYRRPCDVLNDPGVRATGDVLPWLEALFPTGHPYVWHADQF